MARTQIPVTTIVKSGVNQQSATQGSVVNGHYFVNDGATILQIVSADAGSQNVTIYTGKIVDGYALADQTIAVSAGSTVWAGPFTTGTFNQPGTTQVFVDTAATTISFRAFTTISSS